MTRDLTGTLFGDTVPLKLSMALPQPTCMSISRSLVVSWQENCPFEISMYKSHMNMNTKINVNMNIKVDMDTDKDMGTETGFRNKISLRD
jgi:hypothetical protein